MSSGPFLGKRRETLGVRVNLSEGRVDLFGQAGPFPGKRSETLGLAWTFWKLEWTF